MFFRFSLNNWFLPASCALLWFEVYDIWSLVSDSLGLPISTNLENLQQLFIQIRFFCYSTSPSETVCMCVTSCDMALHVIDRLYICCTYILLERSFAIHLNSLIFSSVWFLSFFRALQMNVFIYYIFHL